MITELTSTPRYPEPYLEYWADRYVELDLVAQGVSLFAFLADPHGHLHLGEQPRPLLPAQEAVQARIDAEAEAIEQQLVDDCPAARCRGGALVEPLHHHAYGHDRRRSFFRGGRQGGDS